MCEICDKIISAEKYEQSRNCLFKIQNQIKLSLEKALEFDKRH